MTAATPDGGTLTVEPFGVHIHVARGENLLQAILRAGHYVAFGCNRGGCGTCAAHVVSGQLQQDPSTLSTLDEHARSTGQVLLCSTQLTCDSAVVDVSATGISDEEFAGAAPCDLTVTVQGVDAITSDLQILRLSAPPPPWQPQPGQFLHIEVPDHCGWRAYSIASRTDAPVLELLIRAVPGGAFSTALNDLRPGDPLRIRGPYGSFRLRTSHRRKLFVGAGAGIGPIRAMIHQLLNAPQHPPADLVHIARTTPGLAFGDEFAAFAAAHDEFTYHPLPPDPCRRGTDLVAKWITTHTTPTDLRRTEAYLCGPYTFVNTIAETLQAAGLRTRYLSADRFTASTGTTSTLVT